MKTLKIALRIIGTLVFLIVLAYAYYGGFNAITLETKQSGGETLVYEKMTGDYGQSAEVSDRVYQKLLDDFQIETTKGFGIFYDNPKTTEKEMLRAEVGCILESNFDSIEHLRDDFEVTKYPAREYLVTEFPFKGMPSVLIGIGRVYPALNEYTEENGYLVDSPVMEIWDVPNKKIIYRKELKQL